MFAVTSVMLLVCNSCSKEDGPIVDDPGSPIITEFGEPLGQANEVTIGPEGGTIHSSDGLLSVTIPQGALSGSTVITIQPVTNQAPLGLGNGYRLGPEGLTFENPVTLTFHYSEELLDSNPAEFLWIVFQEPDGSWKAMLESALNSDAKTVTVETSHFSDWSVGRFVDLTLNPVSKSVKKGEKVELAVTGFSNRETSIGDKTVQLVLKAGKLDIFWLKRLGLETINWKVVEWTLNGVKSPVSNNFGNLQSKEYTASYTAPSNVPESNVVAVTVELETTNSEGIISTFYLTSKITIYESDLYLMVEFRGQTYIYYQYGFDGTEIKDPNSFSMAVCGLTDHQLNLGGITFVNGEVIDAIEIYFDQPSKGSRGITGIGDNGNDQLDFSITNPFTYYNLTQENRKKEGEACYLETNETNHVTMTLSKYTGASLSEVEGSFRGTLYYSDENYQADCISSTPYPISGSFKLLLATQ